MRRLVLPTLAAVLALPAAALAQPPAGALPLSDILAMVEQREDVAYFDEVEWDSDGYWEVEFYRPDGAQVEIDIDPLTGDNR